MTSENDSVGLESEEKVIHICFFNTFPVLQQSFCIQYMDDWLMTKISTSFFMGRPKAGTHIVMKQLESGGNGRIGAKKGERGVTGG